MTDKQPVDRETLLPWVEIAHSARMMQDFLSQVTEPTPSSNLAKVNASYPFERASDWCRGFLVAALEHLEMWANYVAPINFAPDAEVVHRFRPVQTLARAAIEGASQAVWVLDTTAPRECVRRHLCLVLDDLSEQSRAASLEDKPLMQKRREALLVRLADEFTEAEIGRFPGYMATVKYAAKAASDKGSRDGAFGDLDDVERLWRSSAGSAHGKRWPSFALQTVLPGHEIAPGTHSATLIPDPEAITRIVKLADSIVTYGVLRFADYAGFGNQIPNMLSDAMFRLAAKVPKSNELL